MWETIKYVGSGTTLLAFIAAVAAWVYRIQILKTERILRSAPEEARAGLVESALEFVRVDTNSLTRKQKYDLAIKQVHARAARFRTVAIVVLVIALLAASISAFAIWRQSSAQDPKQVNQTVQDNSVVNQDLSKTQTVTTNWYLMFDDVNGEDADLPTRERNTGQTSEGKIHHCTVFPYPVFNPFPVTFLDEGTPLCHDFPMIDITEDLNNPRFSQSLEEYTSIRRFRAGQQLVVLLYIDNGGADGDQFQAKDVKITTSLKSDGGRHIISATFAGSNVISPLTGSVTVETNPDEYLEIIKDSGFMFSYEGKIIMDHQGLNLGNSIINLGDLDSGFQYSLFFSYKIKVKKR